MKIIVTGAASGIGHAVARLFATKPHDEATAELLVADRDGSGIEAVAEELRGLGARVQSFSGDLADPAIPAQIVTSAQTAFGGIDVLVSNAGMVHPAPLAELTVADYDRLFAVNTRALVLLAQAARPALIRSRGSIVATASLAASHPCVPLGAYAASKAAARMFVKQIALEWGKDGIRCNCVSPGAVLTGMTEKAYSDEEMRKRRATEIPLGRVGLPQDIAHAIHFLAGPGAAYITGADLLVDGGLDVTLLQSGNAATQRM